MTATATPKVKLNNGFEVPIVGLGTWKSATNVVKHAVKDAVNSGYRHLDCAYMYLNEDEVGEAIKELYTEGTVKREDLFITTKLWNAYHSSSKVPECFKKSLDHLGLAYIDLYLMHWPVAFQEGGMDIPKDENGTILMSDVDYVETWKAMEKLVQEGHCRSIGLSNFNSEQITRILDIAVVKPVMLQIECHPYLNQAKLIDFCKSHNIAVTAYSPLGSPDRMWAKPDDPLALKDPTIELIAKKYGKSPAQVCIRFQTQRGVVVIPKSATKSRIEENIQIFDFVLSEEDMKTITALGDKNYRAVSVEWMKHSKHFPFNIPF